MRLIKPSGAAAVFYLAAFVQIARAQPIGRYQLAQASQKDTVIMGGKRPPSCGKVATRWFNALRHADVVVSSHDIRVNSSAWTVRMSTPAWTELMHPESSAHGLHVQLVVNTPKDTSATGMFLIWNTDKNDVITCADGISYSGTFTAPP